MTCKNCDNTFYDARCPYCEHAHLELLERLKAGESDGALTFSEVCVWAISGHRPVRFIDQHGRSGRYMAIAALVPV